MVGNLHVIGRHAEHVSDLGNFEADPPQQRHLILLLFNVLFTSKRPSRRATFSSALTRRVLGASAPFLFFRFATASGLLKLRSSSTDAFELPATLAASPVGNPKF